MNSLKFSLPALLLLAGTVFFSCETRQGGSSESGRSDSLIFKYTALQDSVNSNWQTMIQDDNAKIEVLNRLLLEVSYTNNYDKNRFDELKEEINRLKAMRYDQSSMSNSALIDLYDSATWDVVDHIIAFARSHPRYPDYPFMAELIDEINEKNKMVLIHRIHYDNWVKELNEFTQKNAPAIKNKIPEFKAEKLPLFELPS